ncbi:YciK family oxidoreductase [Ectothiorhodospira mobilis]|uniref:YciK family oxidoreductase n=1 Tax=Ectothiorhodospira mobilis TaxID=195064 RepID=UPI001EE8324B|nr:YciK family oxidoreductase [Ectothiorhodospira mobilis]MCG5535102.1 YciK family oxidoreductase [Ectothiorhodospira mobilis]
MTAHRLFDYQPDPDLLKDRVILITGAADGIGRALALATARHGATVVLLDKVIKRLEKVYDEIEAAGGPQPAIYPMNLEGATAKDHQDLADNLDGEFGRLDGLVNNAGWIGSLTPMRHYPLELWARVMATNLNAPFLLTHALLPVLEKAPDPSIVFSTHECQKAFWGAFGVAKAGQLGLMRILAAEYQGSERMRVNGVDTGPVRTHMRIDHYPGEAPEKNPPPEEVIAPYLYLLGPESRGTTGENIQRT